MRRSPAVTFALYFFMIIGFAYFYVAVTFDPVSSPDNCGGFGIRAGKPTRRYLATYSTELRCLARYLGVIP